MIGARGLFSMFVEGEGVERCLYCGNRLSDLFRNGLKVTFLTKFTLWLELTKCNIGCTLIL